MDKRPDLGDWNMSDEREFMENLLCQRFNFFLVMFSLVLTAAFTAQSSCGRTSILGAGVVLSLLVWLTIYRAHVKHHWIMQYLYSQKEHPASVVNAAVHDLGWKSFCSVSRLMGVAIPLVSIILLAVFTALSAAGVFGK